MLFFFLFVLKVLFVLYLFLISGGVDVERHPRTGGYVRKPILIGNGARGALLLYCTHRRFCMRQSAGVKKQ